MLASNLESPRYSKTLRNSGRITIGWTETENRREEADRIGKYPNLIKWDGRGVSHRRQSNTGAISGQYTKNCLSSVLCKPAVWKMWLGIQEFQSNLNRDLIWQLTQGPEVGMISGNRKRHRFPIWDGSTQS